MNINIPPYTNISNNKMERIFKVFDFNIYNKKSDDNSSGDEDTKCRQDNNKFLKIRDRDDDDDKFLTMKTKQTHYGLGTMRATRYKTHECK